MVGYDTLGCYLRHCFPELWLLYVFIIYVCLACLYYRVNGTFDGFFPCYFCIVVFIEVLKCPHRHCPNECVLCNPPRTPISKPIIIPRRN